jgi:ABC-type enterobactin transport system permease subunit
VKLPAKITLITLGLSALGAIVGGVLGAVLVALLAVRLSAVREIHLIGLWFAAMFGAAMGAVLAPIAAWTLMRHVPIWRAISDTALGTFIGAGIGLLLQPKYPDVAWLSPAILGLVGFVVAAVRLRLVKRAPARVEQ